MWLCGQPQFDLPASLLLSAASEVLDADLLSEMVLQGEGSTLVCLGPSLRRRLLSTTVTSPTSRSAVGLAKVQKTR